MPTDELDHLLARGRLGGRERERILEGALRDGGVLPPPWYRRKLVLFASPAVACAAVFAIVVGVRAPSDSMRVKGSAARVGIYVECSGAEPTRCAKRDKILFRIEGVPRAVYLSAFGRQEGGGERVWFFPLADGTEPLVPARDSPQVLRQGVKVDSLAAGRYELQVVLSSRPLSKNEVVAASDREVIARTNTWLEVLP